MPGDEDVLEDKPGSCPKCKMDLVPVRLDAKWWCPVHQALEVHDGPGKCRRDGRDLVQVTVAESWTCARRAGQEAARARHVRRRVAREDQLRAARARRPQPASWRPVLHGHRRVAPHRGHVPAGRPRSRVFFYDNFTKPLARARAFTGSVAIRDKSDKEIASAPLAIGKNSTTMEAKIPAANAALPLRATVEAEVQRRRCPSSRSTSSSTSSRRTRRPPVTPSVRRPLRAPRRRPRLRRSRAPPAPARAAAPASAPGLRNAGTTAPRTGAACGTQAGLRASLCQPPDLYAGEIAPMPPALAAALNEEVLPKAFPNWWRNS